MNNGREQQALLHTVAERSSFQYYAAQDAVPIAASAKKRKVAPAAHALRDCDALRVLRKYSVRAPESG